MTPLQLANVLIKILGLSVCVHSVPTLLQILLTFGLARGGGNAMFSWTYAASSTLMLIVGFYLIMASRSVAESLFREGE